MYTFFYFYTKHVYFHSSTECEHFSRLWWRLTDCSFVLCHFSQGLATSWFRPPPAWWWGRWSKVEQDCLNSNNPCSSVRDTKRHVTLCFIVADLASAAARNGFGETHRAEAAVPEHRTAERGSPKPSHPSGITTLKNICMKYLFWLYIKWWCFNKMNVLIVVVRVLSHGIWQPKYASASQYQNRSI